MQESESYNDPTDDWQFFLVALLRWFGAASAAAKQALYDQQHQFVRDYYHKLGPKQVDLRNSAWKSSHTRKRSERRKT